MQRLTFLNRPAWPGHAEAHAGRDGRCGMIEPIDFHAGSFCCARLNHGNQYEQRCHPERYSAKDLAPSCGAKSFVSTLRMTDGASHISSITPPDAAQPTRISE